MATRIAKPDRRHAGSSLESRKTPVQRRSRATVDAILEASAQVFEAHGYAGGTTNRVAKAAGVSIGTLYQYFASKEALAVALLERHAQETQACLSAWVGHMLAENHDLEAALRDYVAGIMDLHSQRPNLQHMLLEETPLPQPMHRVLLEAEQQAVKTMAGYLRTFQEVRRPDLEQAAYLVIHGVETLIHRHAAHPESQTITGDELAAELVAMLRAYLTSAS